MIAIKCEFASRQRIPVLTLKNVIDCCLGNNSDFLRYSVLVKPFLPFKGPSALQDAPEIVKVPWSKTNRTIAGFKLLIE